MSSSTRRTGTTGDLLVGGRIAQGAFAARMVPQTLSTLHALYSPRERAPMYGVLGGVGGLAAVVAPLLGGSLIDADVAGLGRRAIFQLNVPIGIAPFVVAILLVPNTRAARPPRLDLRGVLLLTGGLVGLLYPVVNGRTLGWPPNLWAFATGGAVLLLFVVIERSPDRRRAALLPVSLFRAAGFSAGIVTQAAFQGAMGAFTLAWIVYLQVGLHFDALGAGLTMLPFSLGAFVGVGIAVPLATRFGRRIVTIGGVIEAAGLGWMALTMNAQGTALSGWQLVPPGVVCGIGLGFIVDPLVDITLANVPLPDAGTASGALGTFQQVGAALGVAISGTAFFTRIGGDYRPAPMLAALTFACTIAIGGYLLSAAASLLLPSRADVQRHLAATAEADSAEEAARAALSA